MKIQVLYVHHANSSHIGNAFQEENNSNIFNKKTDTGKIIVY